MFCARSTPAYFVLNRWLKKTRLDFICLDLNLRSSIAPCHDNWAMHGLFPREVLFQAANLVDQ